MSCPVEPPVTTQTPGGPPPPYSSFEAPPPAYATAPPQTSTRYKTFNGVYSDTASEMDTESDTDVASERTPIISSYSSFEDKAVRRGFVRKVCVTHEELFDFLQKSSFQYKQV